MSELTPDPDAQRALSRASWEDSAAHWASIAEEIRVWGQPVADAMADAAGLRPGLRVLDLASGPGDTALLAAARVAPQGTVICSDGAEKMLEVARSRARVAGLTNLEFRALELEWIDLETASVDAVLCRWGIMLVVDPAAAAREIRRVLKPGGRAALAVWDVPERNPWSTIPRAALVDLGHLEPADPVGPGMFSLAPAGRLLTLLLDAGLLEAQVVTVELERRYPSLDTYLEAAMTISAAARAAWDGLGSPERAAVVERLAETALPYTSEDGSLVLPGATLVATASA